MRQIKIGKVVLTKGGNWNATTGYAILTYVLHNGDGWWSIKANVNSEPSATNTNWIQATDTQALRTAMQSLITSATTLEATIEAAEALRVSAESARVSAETARTQKEQERVQSETTRNSNEVTRQSNESTRQSQENTRQSKEQQRVTAENNRVSAETARETASAQAIANANAATANVNTAINNANTAASGAEKVNASISGTTLTITNRNGVSTSVDTKGEKGDKGDIGGTMADAPSDSKIYGRKNGAWVEAADENLEADVKDLNRDFGKYADLADKTLTDVQSGKRFNSTGELVTDSNWSVGKLGAVVVGNTYELNMGSSANMVLGTALFVAHTTETVGTETKDVYTPLFSALSTDIPASGYICFEAMQAYAEVLVSYRNNVSGASTLKVRRYGTKASIATQINNLKREVERKTDMNGLYDGLTAGAALRLVPHGEAATKEVIGLGGRKAGGKNAIDADINARISCIKGYTLMWRQQIPDGGTSGLEGGKITIGGTYQLVNGGTTYNRPYLVCNPTDTAAEDVIEGVTVAAGWSVIRVGTEQEVAFAAGWKLIDMLLTFGREKGHGLNATADVAEAMGYVATESGKTAFDAWQAHTEQFAADMAYSAQTVIRNGRWDGLRSVGKDGDGNAFDFTRSIEQIRRQYFPEGMNGINIGTDSEVCDTIEAGQVVKRVGVVDLGTLNWNVAGNNTFYAEYSKAKQLSRISCYMYANDASVSWSMRNMMACFGGSTGKQLFIGNKSYSNANSFKAAMSGVMLYFALDTAYISEQNITELNLTYPVSNTDGTETPVCEPSTNCSPLAANITYGLDAYATIVDLKKRVEALEKK